MMKASKKSTLSANKKGTSLRVKALHLAVASCFVASPVHAKTLAEYVYEIQRGTAITSVSGSTVTVKNSPGAILNWVNGLNIQSGERLHFDQLSATSAVLNRVGGGSLTKILGTLSSNGKVFLVNPAGIVVGSGARIDTAGFVASTLNISDNDFVNGKMRFNADIANPGNVTVEAHAEIVTPNGGFVYLLAPNVANSGLISTPSGEAILAAGHSIEVVDSTDPALRVLVSAQSKDVNLSQAMQQGGGNIFSVINNGTVSANTAVVGQNGKIQFRSAGKVQTTANSVVEAKGDANADGGLIRGFANEQGTYAGSFDASGKNGGLVETSAAYLDVSGISHVSARALGANGKAGTWLLDPYDFVIGSTEASLISNALGFGSNVIVDTSSNTFAGYPTSGNSTGAGVGDITVNSAINATAYGGQSLSLVADGAITLNADITGTGFGLTMVADANNSSAESTIDAILGAGAFAARGGAGAANDGGIVVNSTVDVDENIYVFNFSNDDKVVLDANAAGHAVSITAGGDVRMITEGGLRLQGGNGSAADSWALIRSEGKMRIGSGGDIELLAGNGTGASYYGNYVSLDSRGEDQRIGFHAANKNLVLTGGSAGNFNSATILNYTPSPYQTVGGYSGLDVNGDPIVDVNSLQFNPIVTITGGAGGHAGIYGSSNWTYEARQYIYAKSITMQGGSGTGHNAFLATNALTSTQEIIASDGTNYGNITLTGGSGAASFTNGNEAGIGNVNQANEVTIEGANITFNAGSQSGSTGTDNMSVNVIAHGNFELKDGARMGGNQQYTSIGTVDISATGALTLSGNIQTGYLNLVSDSDDNGGGGITVNNYYVANDSIDITTYSGAVTLDASAAGKAVGFYSDYDITIDAAGGLVLKGGSGGTLADNGQPATSPLAYYNGHSASIGSTYGTIDITSGGDISLTGGNGVGGNYAEIFVGETDYNQYYPGGGLYINFTAPGKSLTLTGGSTGKDNYAQIDAVAQSLSIGGIEGISEYNPNISINGGSGGTANLANDAGISLHSAYGGGQLSIHASSLSLNGGSGVDAAAYIAADGASIGIQLYGPDGYGDLTMTGGSGTTSDYGPIAFIGSDKDGAIVEIDARNITLNSGSGIGAINNVDYFQAYGGAPIERVVTENTGNVTVGLNTHGGDINITGAKIGTETDAYVGGDINVWAFGGDVNITNSAIGYANIDGDNAVNVASYGGSISMSGANSILAANYVELNAYDGDVGSNSSLVKVAANTIYATSNNVYVEDVATVGHAQITAYESALLRLDDGIYAESDGVTIAAPAAVVYSPNDLYLEYTGIDFQNNAMYGGGDYAVIADNLYMYNGHINGSGEGDKLGVFVNNLEMTYNSNISSFFVGINYDPDTLAAIDALGSFAGVKNNVGQTGSVTVAGGSHINGYGVGINTGELNIDGYGGYYYSSGISGGFVNAITTGDLNITGGDNVYYSSYGGAYLSASYEALLTVGGNINITTGSHEGSYYGGWAAINVADYHTLYLAFPNAQAGGWSVDGVAGAFTSELNPDSGIFVYNQELDNNEAVLGYNVIVSYGNIAKEIEKATDDVSQRSSRDLTNYSDTTKTTEDSGNDSNPFANNDQDNNDNTTDNNDEENNDENKNNKEDPKSC